MNEKTNPSPLIVEQTSKKALGSRENRDFDSLYSESEKLRDKTQEVMPDDFTDVTDHMYNEMYGKAFVHMPSAVTIESMKTVRNILREKGVATSAKALQKNPELRKSVQAIAELVYPPQDQIQTRSHQLALEEKYFKNVDPSNYDIPLDDFAAEDAGFSEDLQNSRAERLAIGIEQQFPGMFTQEEIEELVPLFNKDIGKARKKEYGRIRRKIAETRFLIELFKEHQEYFKGITHVVDMAGGAGDLGIATAAEFPDVEVAIAEYDEALGPYAEYLKKYDPDVADRVTFETGPLQIFDVSEDAAPSTAFVAKHPCGGLKEDIVSKAIDSEVPVVIMMTCCQDKMCDHADQYYSLYEDQVPEISSKEDFLKVAKDSARTNINPEDFKDDPKEYEEKLAQRQRGEDAMRILDTVTVKRLEAAGYDVTMTVMPGAHKGNVIMAKKKAK